MSNDKQPSTYQLYKIALETRNFEIEMFWKRSNYFLVLNTAIAVGYFHGGMSSDRPLIAAFGVVVSIIWCLVNFGSKFWQERWEWKLRDLEKRLNIEKKSSKTGATDYKTRLFAVSLSDTKKDAMKHLLMPTRKNKGNPKRFHLPKFIVCRKLAIYLRKLSRLNAYLQPIVYICGLFAWVVSHAIFFINPMVMMKFSVTRQMINLSLLFLGCWAYLLYCSIK